MEQLNLTLESGDAAQGQFSRPSKSQSDGLWGLLERDFLQYFPIYFLIYS